MDKIRTIIDKEWAEVFKNRLVLFTVIFLPVFLAGLPLLFLEAIGRQISGGSVTDLPPQFVEVCGDLPMDACFQLYMVNQFLVLFLLLPLAIPTTIAAYSIVGEKTTHCLEPLLATPITTAELLIGKGLAAALPAIGGGWLAFGAFAVGARLIINNPPLLARILDPMWLVAIGVVGPLMAIAAVNVTVIVSSRVSDPRAAEQISMVLIVPLMMLFLGQVVGLITINMQVMIIVAGIVLLADGVLVYLGVKLFRRETILTKWK